MLRSPTMGESSSFQQAETSSSDMHSINTKKGQSNSFDCPLHYLLFVIYYLLFVISSLLLDCQIFP